MRPSEAIALQWRDLDLARGQLTVRRKITFYNQTWVFEAPKTSTSKPTVELPGEPVKLRNVIDPHFKRALEVAGLPDEVRLYGLRHIYATLLLKAGENLKIVAARLGHATIHLTADTYCHVLPDMQREGTSRLNAMLFAREAASEHEAVN